MNYVSSTVHASTELLRTINPLADKSNVVSSLLEHACSVRATSIESISQLITSVNGVIEVSLRGELPMTMRDKSVNFVRSLLQLGSAFASEGIGLSDVSYEVFMKVVVSNINFYASETKSLSGGSRKRRDDSSSTDVKVGENYEMLKNFYRMLTDAKVPGEPETVVSGSGMTTRLNRKNGGSFGGQHFVGSCMFALGDTFLATKSDVVEVAECSGVNPYQGQQEGSPERPTASVFSIDYFDGGTSSIVSTSDYFEATEINDKYIEVAVATQDYFDLSYAMNITLDPGEFKIGFFRNINNFSDGIGLHLAFHVQTEDDIGDYGNVCVYYKFKSKGPASREDFGGRLVLSFDGSEPERDRTFFLSGK